MGRTDAYRRQHDEVMALAEQLVALLRPEALARDAGPARAKLSALAAKLKVHLVMEDERLYPAAMRASDEDLASTAKRYQVEMGGIASAFDAYLTKWATAALIQSDPQGFVVDSCDILAALSERVERENTELYPRMEQVPEGI